MIPEIKVGDIITPLPGSYGYKKWGWRFKATVREIHKWEDSGPPSDKNHGIIEYEVIEQVCSKDYPVGTIEHVVYVTWHEWFQISN